MLLLLLFAWFNFPHVQRIICRNFRLHYFRRFYFSNLEIRDGKETLAKQTSGATYYDPSSQSINQSNNKRVRQLITYLRWWDFNLPDNFCFHHVLIILTGLTLLPVRCGLLSRSTGYIAIGTLTGGRGRRRGLSRLPSRCGRCFGFYGFLCFLFRWWLGLGLAGCGCSSLLSTPRHSSTGRATLLRLIRGNRGCCRSFRRRIFIRFYIR